MHGVRAPRHLRLCRARGASDRAGARRQPGGGYGGIGDARDIPVVGKAVKREVNNVTEFDDLLQGGEELLYPRERRYASDNMWTSAPSHALLPGMRKIA